jgi:L-alanine-DL-glutamate epimerase-like enolase superfamily enzyme
VVRLTDEHGLLGWGQSVPVETWSYETAESVESTLRRYLAPAVIGAEPGDLAKCTRAWSAPSAPHFRSASRSPRRRSTSPAMTFGEAGGQAGFFAPRQSREERDQAELDGERGEHGKAEQQLEQGRAAGYDSFNVKIGPPQTPAYDRELVRTVRDFAPSGFHWADANTNYDFATAREMAPRLAHAGFRAFESPLPPNRLRDYQALKRQGRAADPDGRRHRLAGRGGGVHRARHARWHRHEGRALRRPLARKTNH